jgi:hypothetical protein
MMAPSTAISAAKLCGGGAAALPAARVNDVVFALMLARARS